MKYVEICFKYSLLNKRTIMTNSETKIEKPKLSIY